MTAIWRGGALLNTVCMLVEKVLGKLGFLHTLIIIAEEKLKQRQETPFQQQAALTKARIDTCSTLSPCPVLHLSY
jgi:hypothetical protein